MSDIDNRAQAIQLLLALRHEAFEEIVQAVNAGKKPPQSAERDYQKINHVIPKILAGG